MRSLSTYFESAEGVLLLAGILFLLLMANACHEGAHALLAWWNGDRTQRILRRCTLNPVVHFSWFLTLVLPLLALFVFNGMAIIGGAKPVMVDRRAVGRFGMARVAIAGPVANFLFAGTVLVFLSWAIHSEWFGITRVDWVHSWAWQLLVFPLWFAVALGLLNLLPIPGLDGGHILASFLPSRAREIWYRLTPLGLLLLLVLFLWHGGILAQLGIGDPPSGPNVFLLIEDRVKAYLTAMVRFWSEHA